MKKDLTEFYLHNSMIKFLYEYEKRRYGYGILQEIIRELSPLPEGGTSNPAVWLEWKNCVNKSLKKTIMTEPSGQAKHRVYTELQSFNAMVDFFIDYYKRTSTGNLRTLMEIIYNLSEDSTDQASWNDWNNAAKKALQKQDIEKPVDETEERKLTELQAFNAMVKFLEIYYKETGSDFMGGLLSALLFLPDGKPLDSAYWEDWSIAIQKILQKQLEEKQLDEIWGVSLTESQVFKAMTQFFKDHYKQRPDPDVMIFFDYLHLSSNGKDGASPTIREKWGQCVDEVLKEKPGIREYQILCRG